ncbi:hypothetical protein AAF712_016621, partial [Marasmius tenuissimus]
MAASNLRASNRTCTLAPATPGLASGERQVTFLIWPLLVAAAGDRTLPEAFGSHTHRWAKHHLATVIERLKTVNLCVRIYVPAQGHIPVAAVTATLNSFLAAHGRAFPSRPGVIGTGGADALYEQNWQVVEIGAPAGRGGFYVLTPSLSIHDNTFTWEDIRRLAPNCGAGNPEPYTAGVAPEDRPLLL